MRYVRLGHKLIEAIRMVHEGSAKRILVEVDEEYGSTSATIYKVKDTIRIDIKENVNEN